MQDEAEYVILIYHNGVQFEAPVRGHERYLKEKSFLNDLQGWRFPPDAPRPVPDPGTDFYSLSDQELETYSAFRRKLDEK